MVYISSSRSQPSFRASVESVQDMAIIQRLSAENPMPLRRSAESTDAAVLP